MPHQGDATSSQPCRLAGMRCSLPQAVISRAPASGFLNAMPSLLKNSSTAIGSLMGVCLACVNERFCHQLLHAEAQLSAERAQANNPWAVSWDTLREPEGKQGETSTAEEMTVNEQRPQS